MNSKLIGLYGILFEVIIIPWFWVAAFHFAFHNCRQVKFVLLCVYFLIDSRSVYGGWKLGMFAFIF